MNDRFKEPVRQIIDLLVAKKYAELASLTHGVRLPVEEIGSAVADYGRELVSVPEDAFGLMDVVEVKNALPRRWAVTMPLWTQEEGRSDLSVELTLIESGTSFIVELDDIHVL